jgi:hypothetical protein
VDNHRRWRAYANFHRRTESLAARKGGRRRAAAREAGAPALAARRNRRLLLIGGTAGAVIVIVLAVLVINSAQSTAGGLDANTATPAEAACQFKPFRQDQAANLIKGGAVIAYERNGGPDCIDELYAIYPDGRIVGDNGAITIEKQVTLAEVEQMLAGINGYGWFTDEMYNTWHNPWAMLWLLSHRYL